MAKNPGTSQAVGDVLLTLNAAPWGYLHHGDQQKPRIAASLP